VLTRQYIVFTAFSVRRSDAELNAFVEHAQRPFGYTRLSRFIALFANMVSRRTQTATAHRVL